MTANKLVLLLCFFILCCVFPVFGVSQYLELGAGTNGGTGFYKPFFAFSLGHGISFNKIDFFGGAHYTLGQIDLTARARIWIVQKESIALGFGILQHTGWFLGSGREHDFFGSVYASFGKPERFNFSFDASYAYKYSVIPSIRTSVPFLSDKGIAFSLQLQKEFASAFLLYGGVSSYELYRFPLFLMPAYFAGLLYTHPSGLTARSQVNVRYSDQFTLTAYINYICITAGIGCRF